MVYLHSAVALYKSIFQKHEVMTVSFTRNKNNFFRFKQYHFFRFREAREGIERKWFSFIAENLIMYTHLYFIVLTRLSRCDLTTFKISSMSYRLMQVSSGLVKL